MKNLTYLFFLFSTPLLAVPAETVSTDSMPTAIRIEYDLQYFERDSLISYNIIPYKKILVLKEGEVLYEHLAEADFANRLRYYDLNSKRVYSNFKHYETIGKISKLEWVRNGWVITYDRTTTKNILGMPCQTYKVKFENDTLLVTATKAFGFDFYEHAYLNAVPLEFEEIVAGIGKIRYKAVKIDTVEMANERLDYILQNLEIFDFSWATNKIEKSKIKWEKKKRESTWESNGYSYQTI